MRWRALSVTLCLAGVMLGACDAGLTKDGDNDTEPTISADPKPIDPARFVLPLDAYRLSAQQEETLRQAVELLTRSCMRRFGFDYPVSAPVGAGSMNGIGRRYMLGDPPAAASWGYHPDPKLVEASKAARDRPMLSPAAQAVVTGIGQSLVNGQTVPDGGCNGEPARRLIKEGASAPDTQLVSTLSGESYDRSIQHSRVVAVYARWSECMQKAGFAYRTPQDANNDRVFQTEAPTPQEIATATADVRCKQQTNLIGIWAAAETAYQQRAIQRNKLELDKVKRSLEMTVEKAAEVVAGG